MTPTTTHRYLAAGAIASLFGGVLVGCGNESAGGATTTFRLGMVAAQDSVQHQAAEMFAEEIEEVSEGEISIDVFPAGQIGSDETLGQDLSTGALDFAFVNQGSMAGMDPMLDFHYLPYIVTDYEQADEIFYGDGIIPQVMTETLAEHNIRALGWYELEFRGVSTSDAPVPNPDDLAGKKIRVPGSAAINAFFEAAGAQTVTVPFPELYTALQQGTVDGQDNGMIITYDNRLHETNQFYTRTNHVYATGTIAASESTWSGLEPEQQEIVQTAAQNAQDWEVEQERALTEEYVQAMEDEGVEVVDLTPEQTAAYQQLGQSVWDDMADVYGEENISALREEIEAL